MPRFALLPISQVKGRLALFKLSVDNECYFDSYCNMISHDGNLDKQLDRIFGLLDQVANLQRLPEKKFRDITPKKELIKEFEIKTRDLRVYIIKEESHIIVLGGKKNSQVDDIRKFRSLKKQYLAYKTIK